MREFRVRAVDQRDGHARLQPGVEQVHDPHGLGGYPARLQGDLAALGRGGGHARAQAGAGTVRRVLDLVRRQVGGDPGVAEAVREVHARDAAVVNSQGLVGEARGSRPRCPGWRW